MPLEKVFAHRLIRILRWVLPLVVAVLISVPVRNYWLRTHPKAGMSPLPPQLPKELALRTDNFNFSKMQGDRTIFTIHAGTNLGTTDNRNVLQDVEVTIYGEKQNDPVRSLKSRNCSYDQQSENIICTGDVQVRLDEQTAAYSEEILYNHVERRITSDKPARIARSNGKAEANHFDYRMASGLLTLNGSVKVIGQNGVELASGSASIQEKENWVTASGDILMKSKNGWIRGRQARAELVPGSHQPRLISVDGGVTSESGVWQLRSGSIEARLTSQGLVENVIARSNVELRKVLNDDQVVLQGGEIQAHMDDETGQLNTLEATDKPHMTLGSGRSLEADKIRSRADGAISTEGPSVLRAGDAQIIGQEFAIQNGDTILFDTRQRATLTANGRETQGDRTHARFDSRTNRLVELKQDGRFSFKDQGRHGTANTATFQEGFVVANLEGDVHITEDKTSIESGILEINDRTQTQTASGHVKVFSTDPGNPLLVTSDFANRTANTVRYTGHVHVYGNSGSMEADSLESPLNAKSFSGTASGHVFTTLRNARVWADHLVYNDETEIAHYSGHVVVMKQDLRLESGDMTFKVNRTDGAVSEIVARQGVVVTRGDTRGSGDQAVYTDSSSQIVLTGPGAKVTDGSGNEVSGPRIIVSVSGDRMAVVEASGGERAVTKHRLPPQ
jgi:lipopolysaccharide export system protein LptA